VRIVILILGRQPQGLRSTLLGEAEAAASPIPDRERGSIVLLLPLGTDVVVDLVLSGADEEVRDHAWIGQPNAAVA